MTQPSEETQESLHAAVRASTCPSCGVEFQKHLGLVGTCAEVQRLIARVKGLEAFAHWVQRKAPTHLMAPASTHQRFCDYAKHHAATLLSKVSKERPQQ